MLRVYYDNVIVCGRVLQDLASSAEQDAANKIGRLHTLGVIKHVTSRLSGIEQDRTRDDGVRELLHSRRDELSAVVADHRVLGFGTSQDAFGGYITVPVVTDIIDDTLYADLRRFLKDADAKHLMYAVHNDCQVFVTTDPHFLDHRGDLEALCSGLIQIRLPSEFIAEFVPLRA